LFEAVRLIAGFDDVAMMSQPVQQCGGQLGVAEDAAPFREAQIGSDDDAGALIKFMRADETARHRRPARRADSRARRE